MPDDRKTPATPSLDALTRMGRATRYYEQAYREEPLPRSRGPRTITNGVAVAKTNGTISAMGGNRPGSGDVTLYSYEGPGNDVEATDVVVTVSNLGGEIASGTFILVCDGDGGWWPVVQKC